MKDHIVGRLTSSQVISPVPQIEQYKLQPGWEFILVATDGVPDHIRQNEDNDDYQGVGRNVKQRRSALCSVEAPAESTSSPVASQCGQCW